MNSKIALQIRNLDECRTSLTKLIHGFSNKEIVRLTELVYQANAKLDNKVVAKKLCKGDQETIVKVISTYALLVSLGEECLRRSEYGGES